MNPLKEELQADPYGYWRVGGLYLISYEVRCSIDEVLLIHMNFIIPALKPQ